MKPYLCLKCQHLDIEEVDGHYEKGQHGYRTWVDPYILYSCRKTYSNIRTLRKACHYYSPYTQTKLKLGENGMVKLDEVPSEGARLDLNSLPKEIDLIALEENTIAEAAGKTGGLKITFKTKNDERVTQKYTAISGGVLVAACKKLHVKDTKELQDDFFHYVLTDMRMGYPRYIPTSKVKTE